MDSYIDGLLDVRERLAFEKEMRENPELERQVMERQQLKALLSDIYKYPSPHLNVEDKESRVGATEELEMDDDLFRFYYHYEGSPEETRHITELIRASKNLKPNRTFSILPLVIGIAATLALIFIIYEGTNNLSRKTRQKHMYDRLFVTYFHPDKDMYLKELSQENFIAPFNKSNTGKETLEGTAKNGEINEVYRSDSINYLNLLNFSIQRMKEHEFAVATNALHSLIEFSAGTDAVIASWYYGLSLMMDGQIEKARAVFTSICQDAEEYSTFSCKILEDLPEN